MLEEKKEYDVSFKQAKAAPVGTIFVDEMRQGLRFLVMRGPCSLCAYLGIPEDHPLAGKNYDDLNIPAHGGLTYSAYGKGTKGRWPDGYYWFGWDYAHYGDVAMYDHPPYRFDEREWDVRDVVHDSEETINEMAKLVDGVARRA